MSDMYGKIEMINNESMGIVYLERFEDEIKKWYKKKNIPKRLICDINKLRIGDTYVNASAQIQRKYKKFDSFPIETQNAVKLMLSFINDIWANKNTESNDYNNILK
eukprot:gene2333-3310_t